MMNLRKLSGLHEKIGCLSSGAELARRHSTNFVQLHNEHFECSAPAFEKSSNRIILHVLILCCLLLPIGSLWAQSLPVELQTPDIVAENRMPMRATAFAFEKQSAGKNR